jgi:hypothetical protein
MTESDPAKGELATVEPVPESAATPAGQPSSPDQIEIPPMLRQAVEKHHREWEGLMKRHAYQWAMYHGDVRLEIGKSRVELYRKYTDRGFKEDELAVLWIGPHTLDELYDDELGRSPKEPPPRAPVAPMIRKAMEKHDREWEGLMKRYAYQWAAYRGEERLEIGKSPEKLYRKYRDRGVRPNELVVLGIGPPLEDEHER